MALPTPTEILRLEPEELAPLLLEHLKDTTSASRSYQVALQNAIAEFGRAALASGVPDPNAPAAARCVAEAWMVLERGGLVAREPEDSTHNGYFLTRRGVAAKTASDVRQALAIAATPRDRWHPLLQTTVYHKFVRGEYESAVLEAFKLVEIAVREATTGNPKDIGVPLMRGAFRAGGRLTDNSDPPGEQVALLELFAGAIGRFKNPSSHHLIPYDTDACREALGLASFLLRVIDTRRAGKDTRSAGKS